LRACRNCSAMHIRGVAATQQVSTCPQARRQHHFFCLLFCVCMLSDRPSESIHFFSFSCSLCQFHLSLSHFVSSVATRADPTKKITGRSGGDQSIDPCTSQNKSTLVRVALPPRPLAKMHAPSEATMQHGSIQVLPSKALPSPHASSELCSLPAVRP
jgi:hypothetical protein